MINGIILSKKGRSVPAMAWLWGPPCSPGNTAWLIRDSRLYMISFPLASTPRTPAGEKPGEKPPVVEKRWVHGGWFERRICFYTGTFPVENDAWAAAAERLVCCCGHDVAVLKRWWHNSSSYQTADVCHVWHQICAVLISDLPHASIIKVARIATCSLGGKN